MTKESDSHQNTDEKPDECILYELLVYSEWKQDPEFSKTTKQNDGSILSVASQPSALLQYLRGKYSLADDIKRLLLRQLPWQFAVGESGKVVAILQETLLEIRITRDEYSSVVGKAVVQKDNFPQLRKLAWSPDCSMLAIAHSNGTVSFYDLLGSNIFTIFPPKEKQETKPTTSQNPFASILFLQPRIKNPKWSNEVVLIDYSGNLSCYLVSPTDGYQENHTFSFASHYRQGVAAVSYHPSHNLLFVAGASGSFCSDTLEERGSSVGLSVWRILNDYPYYRLTLADEEEEALLQARRSLWNWIPSLRSSPRKSMIFKMQVSPKGKLLACLHTCGEISVWHLPAIKLYRYWPLYEQPAYDANNPRHSGFHKRKLRMNSGDAQSYYYPVDVNWWSERAMIIARYSGAVSVCTVRSMCNLLGEWPEFLEGQPQISAQCNDRGFLGLECESVLTSLKRPTEDISTAPSDTEESSDDDEDGSLLNRSSAVLQSAVYMVTDMERFQPKRKRPKYLYKTYRLLGLKSTTPEELYTRKIDNEEYGDALDLARTYNLDCDLVYQRQWRNSKVSINTIRDYLSKITKRSWVLSECIQRVPETFDAALELLEFGLRGTNLETLHAIGEGTDGGHFVLRSPEEEEDLSRPLDEEAVKEYAAQRKKELLSKIDVSNLTEDQRELLLYRHKLLQYLDMLRTYEKIEGEARLAEIMYSSAFYDKFRSGPLIASTVEFAREGKCFAVKTMFTYHGEVLLPHWLPILSNFPETTNPCDYELLLPECDSDGSVLPWSQLCLREKDWSEQEDFRQALGIEEDSGESFIYDCDPDLHQFCCPITSITSDLLSEWYKNRVNQIESRSCMVDHALTLVKLAQARNIEGLETLYSQLLTLESLVYDVHIEDVSLAALQKLTDFERAKLLMSKTTEATFVEDVKRILLPYVVRCERHTSGSKMQVLKSYLMDLSSKDLSMPLRLFEHLYAEQPNILALWEDAVNLALDCVYIYPNADQLDIAFKILGCISDRGFSPLHQISSTAQGRIRELECDLHASNILKENGLPKPVTFVRDCKTNANTVQQLLIKLARTVARQVPPPTKVQWEQLLNDMLSLQSKVFQCISVQLCYEIYAETLLSSGNVQNIYAASDILEVRKNSRSYKKVPFERSVALVLQVSREYFDSSGSLVDPSMELAKACLHLIVDEDDDIQENLDLIASLQILNDFGLTMLPLHVRQCSDRMRLVESCIHKKPLAYRKSQKLLQLAQKLRVAGKDARQREGKVLAVIAETALEAKDYNFCAEICQRLVAQRHMIGWEVVQQLGQCQEFSDLKLRHSLLGFALLYCSSDMIEVLVNTRCLLEAELLHEEINDQVDLSAIDEEEFSDALTSPMSPQKEFPPSSLGLSVGRSTEAIKKTTYNLIQNISDKEYWKNTFKWNWDGVIDSYAEDEGIDEPLSRPGVPEFYASLSPGCHASRLVTRYDRFSKPDIQDSTLKLCQAMLSTLMLEETGDQNTQKKVSSEVFSKLAEHLLPEDCSLGLGHLLAVEDLEQAELCFRNLPCTSISLQLAVYYYALQSYLSMIKSSGDKQSWIDAFLFPPNVLVDYVLEVASKMDHPVPWIKKLKDSQTLLADYLQGEQLQASGCGVDLERFTNDAEYRCDSILGLALTVEEDRFRLALSLGARHGVPGGQVASMHVNALFLDHDEISFSELSSRLNDPVLVDLLHSQPHEVCERLTHHVYPSVSGTDHQLLILYFDLLSNIAEHYITYSLTPKEHVKLLKKIKAISSDIDYKKLVENPSRILDILQPILRKENVNLVAKLLKGLPENLGCETKPGALYSLWAQLEFFQVAGVNAGKVISSEQWQKQYEACSKYFTKMTANDLLNFGKGVVFSERSLDLMTVEYRKNVLQQLLFFCNMQLEQQVDLELSKEWSEASETLGLWLTHLTTLSSKKAAEVYGDKNGDFQLLLRRLDLSRGEAGPILKVLQSAVMSSVPLSSLQMLLELLPQPSPTARQLFEDMLNFAIAGIRSGSEEDALQLLPAVLKRLQESVEQRDAGTLPADAVGLAWKQLEPLCGDQSLTPEIRLQALSLLQSLKVVPEDTVTTLLFHHTHAAIALSWPGDTISVEESEVSSESQRHKLFVRLQSHVKTWQQMCTLKELLDKWPPFQDSAIKNTSDDPWLRCVQQIVNFEGASPTDIEHVLVDIFKKWKFSEEYLQELVLQSKETGNVIALLLVCLLSDYSSLHETGVTLIHKYYRSDEPPLSPRLCTLLLQEGLIASVVGTPAYYQLVNHLLYNSDGKDKLPDVNTVLDQLIANGYAAEAGTLKLRHMRAPAPLSVLSTALQLAKRMLYEE